MATLQQIARNLDVARPSMDDAPPDRLFSIREICSWILPVSGEYLRRTLRETEGLPRGRAEVPGGPLRFTATEIAGLRDHFARTGQPGRYRPVPRDRAPVVVLAAPLGRAGRSLSAAHLAVAGTLAGWRVLLVDGDGGGAASALVGAAAGASMRPRLARAAADALRRRNAARVERGERPDPMPAALAEALATGDDPGPGTSRWPGLGVWPGGADLAAADSDIARWERDVPGWSGAEAVAGLLAEAATAGPEGPDLVLVDPPRGLGPVALGLLGAADLWLVPVPPDRDGRIAAGLRALDAALAAREADAAALLQALGRAPEARPRPPARLLPLAPDMEAGPDALPPLPDPPPPGPGGRPRLWPDVDPREAGRLAHAAAHDALARSWAAFAAALPQPVRSDGTR